jgi:hypothetical protein
MLRQRRGGDLFKVLQIYIVKTSKHYINEGVGSARNDRDQPRDTRSPSPSC